MRGSHVLCRP